MIELLNLIYWNLHSTINKNHNSLTFYWVWMSGVSPYTYHTNMLSAINGSLNNCWTKRQKSLTLPMFWRQLSTNNVLPELRPSVTGHVSILENWDNCWYFPSTHYYFGYNIIKFQVFSTHCIYMNYHFVESRF